MQTVYQNNYFVFFFLSLCRRRWCFWRTEDPECPRKRGRPTGAGRPWHPLHRVTTGGPELAVCGPQRGPEPGAQWATGPPWGAECAGWKSSSYSPSRREASSVTTPAHTHRKHSPLCYHRVQFSFLLFSCLVLLMKCFLFYYLVLFIFVLLYDHVVKRFESALCMKSAI